MLKTLLITNSYDSTSDLMVELLGSGSVFRLNYDLIHNYEIKFTADSLSISSAVNTITQNDIVKVFWRKTFSGQEEFEKEIGPYNTAEFRYLLRELANFFDRKGLFVLNRFDAELRCGKILQAYIAKNYFSTPNFNIQLRSEDTTAPIRSVVKSLSGVPFQNGDVLYTTEVSARKLAGGNLWYLQDLVEAVCDVTVVYVYGELFAFQLDRDNFAGLDWRKDVFEMAKKWEPYKLEIEIQFKIQAFMKDLQWNYGRLDFLLTEDGSLLFLEVNANGQWGWLDAYQDNGLFAKMIDCVNPLTAIPVVP